MNKNSFIALCNLYKTYQELQEQICGVLDLIEDDAGAIVNPIKETFYTVVNNEFLNFSEEIKDSFIKSIEDVVYAGRLAVFSEETDKNGNILEKTEYITSFADVYDMFLNKK